MISRRSGKRYTETNKKTLTAVIQPTSIKKQVTDVSLTLALAHMGHCTKSFMKNVREGEKVEKATEYWGDGVLVIEGEMLTRITARPKTGV